ncbi:hypothetical protein C8J57DRAFT_1458425 [Mycena rebaudengoi]|nr:hypothetical protein C8J57DRAFT_1458425 [Mycena rebaudengoi]
MHHFFSVPELVELLCEEVGDQDNDLSEDDPATSCQDLAAFACTATVFQRPALDALWLHQESLINIVLCMPADLWESEESVKDQSNFALARPITPSDLERPLIYSRRAKSLALARDALTLDLFRILEAMKPFLPQGILFPNLRQLDLFLKDERDGTIIPYLSFAPITSIHLGLDSSWSSLPDLPLLYPALKHLEISSNSPDPVHLLTSTSVWVRKLNQIEELTLPMLDRAEYDHLSTLPTLHSLTLTKRTMQDLLPSIPSHPTGHTGFPALRSLETQSTTLEFVTEAVNGFSNTPLRSLNAATYTSGSQHLIQHFFAALSTHVMHTALEKISLRLGVKGEDGPDFDGQTLSHLLCFSNLREVIIHLYGEFLLDDATVWDMARAWPNLVKLELIQPKNVSRLPPILGLASLRAFATHCPELISLTLAFDATVVPRSSSEQPVVQNKLLALFVLTSPISADGPNRVARFLKAIFPNIEYVEPFSRSRPWQEVEYIITGGAIH